MTAHSRGLLSWTTLATLSLSSLPASAAVPDGPSGSALVRHAQGQPPASIQPPPPRTDDAITLYDGSTLTLGQDGFGVRTDIHGRNHPFLMMRPQGRSAMGGWGPDTRSIVKRASLPERGRYVPGEILVAVDGAPSGFFGNGATASELLTGDRAADDALRAVGAISARPLAPSLSGRISGAQKTSSALDLSRFFVVRLKGMDPVSATQQLRGATGIAYAAPNWTVSSMALEPHAIPSWVIDKAQTASSRQTMPRVSAVRNQPSSLPTNYGLASSFEAHLNANGVNAVGAFDILSRRFGALPGDGVIVTNVSIGDLTDQSMADAGDFYVQIFGPTTVVTGGQRYLDIPSMPLIPAWGAAPDGTLDPLAQVEFVDPYLSEVLLDFSMMAPLPHDLQRPGREGSGLTDLLGIAPGAQYRLVVPQEPTIANILAALIAAAHQEPRPDVITASLGFGFDTTGFPARDLEDDPAVRAAVRSIVADFGIVVCISSNDGTRLFTPAAIGPDGGSAPTDLPTAGMPPTSVDQVAASTAPSRLDDTGSIEVGGSTLDDVFVAPPLSGTSLSAAGTFSATRYDGSTSFSSGFGTRLNLSGPSDNIPAFVHACDSIDCPPNAVIPVLNGGTSASTPMVAAAAAIAIQSSRLAGAAMAPSQVRAVLAATGRSVPSPPQSVVSLAVGKQLDLTAAVESILGADHTASIVRLSVAHRQALADLGATFTEATDPSAIDLEGPPVDFEPPSGQNLTGPISIAADVAGKSSISNPSFALTIGAQTFVRSDPTFRLLPSQILAAAGLPVVSTGTRSVPLTYQLRSGNHAVATRTLTLTFGPSDGTYAEALPPTAPATVTAGKPFTVAYNLSKVRGVNKPRLIISSVDHWSPAAAPLFRNERVIPISANDVKVTVPADAITGGAGLYGIGIQQDSENGIYGWFEPIRVLGAAGDTRPPAPVLSVFGGIPGYSAVVSRSAPAFTVKWDASHVPGATGAALEISAPGQTIWGSINTFTNQNGDRRDNNGVDAGSTLWYPLPGTAGTLTLDAGALGLPSSLIYSVRILATNAKGVVGGASAVSGLEFDDGFAPGGEIINDFDVVPGGGSIVATAGYDAFGNLADSALVPYDQGTGSYGAPIADDPSGLSNYYMFGSDTTLHRTVTIRYDWYGTLQDLETYDSLSGAKLADVPVDSAYQFAIVGGRVDSTRHRAALLGWSGDDFSDNVLPFHTDTGVLDGAIFADVGTDDLGVFTTLDVDAASGNAFLASMFWGDLCLFFDTFAGSANLDTAQAAPVAPVQNCVTGLAADQRDRRGYLTIGPMFGFPRLFPPARLQTFDQSSLHTSNLSGLGPRSPLFPVVDTAHGLLIAGFVATDTYLVDNNAMSAIGVFNANSGSAIAVFPTFNFIAQLFGGNGLVGNERGIQLDPATRTGWTYGPGGVQVQRFRY